MSTTKRTGLTIENIFQRKLYVNILGLLDLAMFKPMRQAHLEEKLVRSSKRFGKETYFTGDLAEFLKYYTELYPSWNCVFPDVTFKSKYGLRRALDRLKKLELIDSYKPEKPKHNYSSLRLTDKGERIWLQFFVRKRIEAIDDIDIVRKISGYIHDIMK